jgi:hypothetical protein
VFLFPIFIFAAEGTPQNGLCCIVFHTPEAQLLDNKKAIIKEFSNGTGSAESAGKIYQFRVDKDLSNSFNAGDSITIKRSGDADKFIFEKDKEK